MIAWDSFYTYILKPTGNIKIIIATILIATLFIRRTRLIERLYHQAAKLSTTKILALIFFSAFLLRFFWILWSPHVLGSPITEDWSIWRHANELAIGGGYRTPDGEFTTFRPVGYPLFLSLLIRFIGPNVFVVELVQVLFGVLTVYCLFLIGSQLHSKLFGSVTAAVLAFHPTSIMSTKIIADEHLFLLLWLAALNLLISDFQKPSYKKVVLGGLILGLSAIVRTHSVVTVGAMAVVWIVAKRGVRLSLWRSFLLVTIVLLCASPWAIRNQIRLGQPIFYTSIFGKALYQANNQVSNVRYPVNPTIEQGCDPVFCGGNLSELEFSAAGTRAAWKWIKKNPSIFLQKCIGRTFYMLGFTEEGWVIYDNFTSVDPNLTRPSKSFIDFLENVENYTYIVIFSFFVLGSLFWFAQSFTFKDEKGWGLIPTTIFFYLVVPAIALGHRKYRFPIEPLFCLMAVYAIYYAVFGFVAEKFRTPKTCSAQAQTTR